jgi:hypothetical protein
MADATPYHIEFSATGNSETISKMKKGLQYLQISADTEI